MGIVKANLDILQEQAADPAADLPSELTAQIQLTADDFWRFTKDFIAYQNDRDELPQECSVCGESTIPAGLDPDPGDQLPAEKICITEASDDFGWDAILHLEPPHDTDASSSDEAIPN